MNASESILVNVGVAVALVAAFWFVARRITRTPLPLSAAVIVTDPVYLAWVRGIYTDVLARVRAKDARAVVHTEFSGMVAIYPGKGLPSPYAGRWGLWSNNPEVDGFPRRMLVFVEGVRNRRDMVEHECMHDILNRGNHPVVWFNGSSPKIRV